MNPLFLIVPILLPTAAAVWLRLARPAGKHMEIGLMTVVLINTVLVWGLLLNRPAEGLELFRFTRGLSVTLRQDGVGSVFAGIIATLWPLATLYAYSYMHEDKRIDVFLTCYTLTYSVTLGIAFAGNLLTLYLFYELLTLATVPLVMHDMTPEALAASRKYLYYSLGGAAFAFIGMIFILIYGSTSNFTPGGVLDVAALGEKSNLLLFVYVLCFCGFSVKAAMCPFCAWLPKAGVAPTPVTALLHAVAVVKAGAFATMRITYFSFGTELLRGTWAQNLVMALTIVTIIFGCSRALKETHFKRRLAWSTVSNLSYILFGIVLMTPLGLAGAFSHMICHAVMKIGSFFCAGAVIYKTGRIYIHQLDGLGRKMPKVFLVFTIASMALMGVPGLCGFVSKWNLAKGAVAGGTPLAYAGLGAILISALLTAIYMLTIVVRAFFPGKDFDYGTIADIKDPNWMMLLPLCVFVIVMFIIGIHPQFLTEAVEQVVAAVFAG